MIKMSAITPASAITAANHFSFLLILLGAPANYGIPSAKIIALANTESSPEATNI